MVSSNFMAQSGLMKSGEAYTYSFHCVNVCFCAVGETLVSIECRTKLLNCALSLRQVKLSDHGIYGGNCLAAMFVFAFTS